MSVNEKTIEQLQQELEEVKQKLEAERVSLAAKYKQERDEMILLADMENKQRLSEHRAKLDEAERRMREQAEAAETRRRLEVAARAKMEQEASQADAQKRLYQEKLAWIEKAVTEAEFNEEQHRKRLEDMKNIVHTEPTAYETGEINVEHPVAPLNVAHPGEAVEDTAGGQDNSAMSVHLKQILRQAQRP